MLPPLVPLALAFLQLVPPLATSLMLLTALPARAALEASGLAPMALVRGLERRLATLRQALPPGWTEQREAGAVLQAAPRPALPAAKAAV